MAAVAQTYDYSDGGVYAPLATGFNKFYVAKRIVDVPTLIAAGYAAGKLAASNKITAAEMIGVINIPKNTWVLGVTVRIITPGTASATIDIGDGANEQGYDAAVAIDSAAGTNTGSEADSFAVGAATSGKIYSAADTIDIQFNADTTTGKFLVQALCVDISDPTDA